MPLMPTTPDRVNGILSIAQRSVNLSLSINTAPSKELCDIVIEPLELVNYHIFDTKHIKEMHDLGYEYTQRILPELKERLSNIPWEEINSEKPQSPPDA